MSAVATATQEPVAGRELNLTTAGRPCPPKHTSPPAEPTRPTWGYRNRVYNEKQGRLPLHPRARRERSVSGLPWSGTSET